MKMPQPPMADAIADRLSPRTLVPGAARAARLARTAAASGEPGIASVRGSRPVTPSSKGTKPLLATATSPYADGPRLGRRRQEGGVVDESRGVVAEADARAAEGDLSGSEGSERHLGPGVSRREEGRCGCEGGRRQEEPARMTHLAGSVAAGRALRASEFRDSGVSGPLRPL